MIMGFGGIIGLILLVVIGWYIMKTVNQNSSTRNSDNTSALEILKGRYARGEIEKKEFEERKKDLM